MMAPTAGAADSYASPRFDTLIGSSEQRVFFFFFFFCFPYVYQNISFSHQSEKREGERPSKTTGKIYLFSLGSYLPSS